jgi:hypothetical protein
MRLRPIGKSGSSGRSSGFRDCIIHVVRDAEEVEVLLGDEAELEQILPQKGHERLPIAAAGLVDEHDGDDPRLAVCISVSTSKPSSIVPKPAGKSATPCVSFMKFSLRVKK